MKKLLNSKTFQFLLIAFGIATVALLIGRLSADLWVDLVKWLAGFGTARGSTEHIELFKKEKKHEIEQDLRSAPDDELARRVVERTDQG